MWRIMLLPFFFFRSLLLFLLTRLLFEISSEKKCTLRSRIMPTLEHCKYLWFCHFLHWDFSLDMLVISIHLFRKNFSWPYSIKWDHVKIVKLFMKSVFFCINNCLKKFFVFSQPVIHMHLLNLLNIKQQPMHYLQWINV